jgi:hypothetical protein
VQWHVLHGAAGSKQSPVEKLLPQLRHVLKSSCKGPPSEAPGVNEKTAGPGCHNTPAHPVFLHTHLKRRKSAMRALKLRKVMYRSRICSFGVVCGVGVVWRGEVWCGDRCGG